MNDRLNLDYCANAIARAIHEAMRTGGHITRVDIDCIRCAVIGYLACGPHHPSSHDTERLVDLSLRKFVEKCP